MITLWLCFWTFSGSACFDLFLIADTTARGRINLRTTGTFPSSTTFSLGATLGTTCCPLAPARPLACFQ